MIIKWLNQHPQIRNTAFWTSVVSTLAMLITKIASLMGYQIADIVGHYQEQILYLIGLILAVLAAFLPPPKSQQKDNNSSNQNQANQ